MNAIEIEKKHMVPFFSKSDISIERGEGIYVYDENGKQYIDLTAGLGVTCLGHAHPVITEALAVQARKILQNPDPGKTYSPVRSRLLELLAENLPHNLRRIFFSNSGAEANDAAIKLARKVSGRMNVISTDNSFHGRTLNTLSATGYTAHRERYSPLVSNYFFVPYDNVEEVAKIIRNDVAAVIVEPIQGEGGINVPSDGYLERLSELCDKHGVFLILDEIQTGFFRTGTFFCSSPKSIKVDFMTMAKGIAGGFPFGAFAMTEDVAKKIEVGDHGGTYCGNPLGCAVSYAVVDYLFRNDIAANVNAIGAMVVERLNRWKREFPGAIADVRGRGLLLAMEMTDDTIAARVRNSCLDEGAIVNVTRGNVIRIFPALNITKDEMESGLAILGRSIERHA